MRFRLLQAREDTDSAKREEHEAFAGFLDVPLEDVVAFDLLQERISAERIMADVDAVLVGEAERLAFATKPRGFLIFVTALGEIAEAGFPMFCSCFGFQGLALALGADVQPDAEGAEVGTYSITVREEGKSDPLFSKLPDTFMAQQGAQGPRSGIAAGFHLACLFGKVPVSGDSLQGPSRLCHPVSPGVGRGGQSSRFRNYFDLYKGVYGEARAREILEEICPSPEANGLLREFRRLLESR